MCSIFGILDIHQATETLRPLAIAQSARQRHRGPDWSGVWQSEHAILVHERLAIVDINSGEQPLVNQTGELALLVNGEIYNHQQLAKSAITDYQFQTQSDCEIILALYSQLKSASQPIQCEQIAKLLNQLQGMFGFILFDRDTNQYLIARDPIGIIPLYYGFDDKQQLYVASEMKALQGVCQQIEIFPPGHFVFATSKSDAHVSNHQPLKAQPYYHPQWRDYQQVARQPASPAAIHDALVDSVKRHLMSDVPYGVLLSGGLDSSVIAAIAKLNAEKRVEDDQQSPAWWPQLHSFAVGLKGSPDLIAAQKVADHIGTIHHSVDFSLQQGIDALSEVIYHLETYDVTTIRAATPMFLMARKIKSMGIKMVLSGEGADEIFGGYLYFHKAPNANAFHQETLRKLDRLHQFDCLRANKAMAAWGVEARVPFLDRQFLDCAMSISPEAKMCGMETGLGGKKIEKHILRQAFDGYLPEEILWRQKEQFSDGVGYSWIDGLKDFAETQISDQMMQRAAVDFPINPPDSKEALYYRQLFAKHFAGDSAALTVPGGKSVACSSQEALAWDKSFSANADPSGRAVAGVHLQANS